ncbi:apolipoprotein N-acyltransferase [Parashewanella spongiae]|uniref:Apolipoprotein N-acyltransferase n=1 Tax=Parashewanella spongiae TaxID=342950 RepID=A0A3A6TR91_9GAMM|nr:apolipoprotein N-acyltransferase [Parashewanella spongiae]MCL1077310.1 apolipoprotein N-acyltransferase [Parashewanella spongiae]RJY18603.1 apolipoprotein N-acyltransferase [Parashewanella spongiae]
MLANLFSSRKIITRCAAAFITGASCVLAFSPYDIWIVLPIAMGFTLWQSRVLTPKQSFNYWLSFGFGYFAIGISWVHVSMANYGGLPLAVSMLLMAMLALYLALFPAFTGYLNQKLTQPFIQNKSASEIFRTLLLFPALWVTLEWSRGWMLTGFPWLWAGYSQTEGPLASLASSIGALGISYVIAMIAGLIALLLQKRWLPTIVILPVILLAAWVSPKFSTIEPTGESMKLAMVQGNIPQSTKWQPEALWPTMIKYMDLTRDNFDAEVIIWPEAAIPAPEALVVDFLETSNKAANLNNSAIVTGIISQKQSHFYNTLITLGNSNQAEQPAGDYVPHSNNEYKKHHLLPIGEFVPFQSLLRPLAPLFNLPMSSFSRGDYIQPDLRALGYKITPAICFEIAFPEQVRANLKQNSDVILTVSNDAWFGTSIGPLQHMQIAQMRAIELGRPVLRSTNNGVTALVDANGIIIKQIPQFETAVLRAKVPLVKGKTLFYQLGQWPILFLCFSIILFFVGKAVFSTRKANNI